MSYLAELQRAFQSYVLDGTAGVAEHIEPGLLANHERRLAIYHDAYRLRLVEALGTDFEALAAVLGAEGFQHACRAYVETHPSAFRNVRWYAGRYADFLQSTLPWSARPEWADLARFEWTLTLAFDAADAAHLTFGDLATLPADAWGSIAFRLHPSVQVIHLRANAPAIRMAVDAQAPLPAIELAEQPLPWLIWRKDLSPHFRSLSEPEAWALQAVREGATFPTVCEGLCEWIEAEEASAAAASWLRTWVDDQLITALRT